MKLQFNTHHNMQHRILTINVTPESHFYIQCNAVQDIFNITYICIMHKTHILLSNIHIG